MAFDIHGAVSTRRIASQYVSTALMASNTSCQGVSDTSRRLPTSRGQRSGLEASSRSIRFALQSLFHPADFVHRQASALAGTLPEMRCNCFARTCRRYVPVIAADVCDSCFVRVQFAACRRRSPVRATSLAACSAASMRRKPSSTYCRLGCPGAPRLAARCGAGFRRKLVEPLSACPFAPIQAMRLAKRLPNARSGVSSARARVVSIS